MGCPLPYIRPAGQKCFDWRLNPLRLDVCVVFEPEMAPLWRKTRQTVQASQLLFGGSILVANEIKRKDSCFLIQDACRQKCFSLY